MKRSSTNWTATQTLGESLMTPSTEEVKQKPRLAVAIATALGVGYAPKAPGTFGSLVGVATAMLTSLFFLRPHSVADLFSRQRLMERTLIDHHFLVPGADIHDAPLIVPVTCAFLLLVPVAMPNLAAHMDFSQYAIYSALSLLNWRYLLAGFVLFRLFDIWKPFPIRDLEKLHGGWGIMADDWLAGVYAAILLKVALHFSLL